MLSVQLGWTGTVAAGSLAAAWRTAGTLPPPVQEGLLARQWLLDDDRLYAQVLFREDPAAAAEYLRDLGRDASFDCLASRIGLARAFEPRIEHVPDAQRLERPIFIIASPRSGSTLLFDLLAQAPGVWTQGAEGGGAIDGIVALHPAGRGFDSDRLTEADATPDAIACLHAGWRFGLRDRAGSRLNPSMTIAPRLLDKTTENSLRVALLAKACPDARFVFLHRDARQSVSSLMKAWEHGGFVRFADLPGWHGRAWCFLLPPGWRGLSGRALQARATAQWEAANQFALQDLETLEPARWTSVDYNELVARPRCAVERLCAFLDLAVDAAFNAHLRWPLPVSGTTISPPSTLKWRSHAELDVAQLEQATRVTSARLRHLHPQAGAGAAVPLRTSASVPIAALAARFACCLADVPPSTDPPTPSADALFVEPDFRFQVGVSIPLKMATSTRFRDRFLQDQPIVWTRDRLTQARLPYWVERHQVPLFTCMEANTPSPACAEPLASRLHAVGVTETIAERLVLERRAAATRERLRGEFAHQGYCAVRGLLPKPQVAALARYYRALVETGGWALGDAQVTRRHGWHNESVARFYHHQLTSFAAALAGAPVCASYCYVSAYQRGAELDPHVDRKQCAYTMSFIVDEHGGNSVDWPLWFLAGAERSAVTLAVGDAVLFRGHDIPHWRESAPQAGLALSTLLFHYVPTDFAETLS